MVTYVLMMMTSWAIVCDVWYLPPMTRDEVGTWITMVIYITVLGES